MQVVTKGSPAKVVAGLLALLDRGHGPWPRKGQCLFFVALPPTCALVGALVKGIGEVRVDENDHVILPNLER